MSSSTCQYRFEPAEWEREHGRPATLDTVWSCSRDAEAETGYCKYHLSPERRTAVGIDDESLCESLLSDIADGSECSLRFVGANFGDVDISHEVISRTTNNPIDFRYATVHGNFIAKQAVIRQPILMDEATVQGRIDFSDTELGEDVSIRQATFAGEVLFENTDFEDDCVFANSIFHERANFDQVQFAGVADFYATQFDSGSSFVDSDWKGTCRFQRACFEDTSSFRSSRFHSRADFRAVEFIGTNRFSRSRFEDEVLFIHCEFSGGALFKKTSFVGTAYYQSSSFYSEASFTETTFNGKVKFHFADFHGEAVFSYSHFGDAAYFKTVEFQNYASFYESTFDRLADFRKGLFADTARFMKSKFNDEVFFDRSTFVGDGDFRYTSFQASSHFIASEFHAGAIMQNTSFSDAIFRDIKTPDDALTINLEQAGIDAGEFVQTSGGNVYYNVREGRIGDIDIRMPATEQIFERFWIYRTEFDGFDFSNYRYVLAPKWVLHTFKGKVEHSYDLEADRFSVQTDIDSDANASGVDPAFDNDDNGFERITGITNVWSRFLNWLVNPAAPDLEVTYLKAKNGAEKVGDSQAASRFFIKEMGYRRQTHLHRVFKHSEPLITRLQLLFLAAMNLTLSLTCGYGEKPRRTLGFSLLTIGVYAVIFSSFVSDPPFGSSAGYLLLSVQAFTTLIFGSSASTTGFLGSFIATTEGFIGAFIIGLFIFALTRSVHR